jgi:hypothetical protein
MGDRNMFPLSKVTEKGSQQDAGSLPSMRTDYRWVRFKESFQCFFPCLRAGFRGSDLRLLDGTGVSLRKLIFGSFQYPSIAFRRLQEIH